MKKLIWTSGFREILVISPRKSIWKVEGKSLQPRARQGDQPGKMGCCFSNVKVKVQVDGVRSWCSFALCGWMPFVILILMLMLVDADLLPEEGRGHNFQHLGRCTGQVRQVELQVLRRSWLIWKDKCEISQQLLMIWWSGILRWVQGSGSSPTQSGKIKHLRKCYKWESWTGWALWVWQGRRPGWRTRSTSSTSTSPSLATSRCPSIKPIKMSQFVQSKVGLRPKQADIKGRVAVRTCLSLLCLKFHRPGEGLPAHAWPQHRAGPHQHQGHWIYYFCWQSFWFSGGWGRREGWSDCEFSHFLATDIAINQISVVITMLIPKWKSMDEN